MKGGGAEDGRKITEKVLQILQARYDQHRNTDAELNILYRATLMSKAWCQSKTAAAWKAAHATGTAAPTDLAPAAGVGSRCVPIFACTRSEKTPCTEISIKSDDG